MKWFLKCLRQYADFSGRARRKEYWMFVLFNFIFFSCATILGSVAPWFNVIALIYTLAIFIPGLAVTFRRLHDTGRSGWWILLALIPVGTIVIVIFMLLDGEIGENVYGPDPMNEKGVGATSAYVPKSEFIETPVNTATLSALRCPQCDSKDYIPLGKKGAIGKALSTQLFIGAIGNIIAAKSDAKSVSSTPLQYRCKNCKSKFTAEPSESTTEEHLSRPCRIILQRRSNMAGAALPYVVYLNGIKVGVVNNGKAISFNTWVKENVVFVTAQGVAFPACKFIAEQGSSTVILFNRKIKQIYNVGESHNKNGDGPQYDSKDYIPLSSDEDAVYLQAVPIARKRMDLLWLDPTRLKQVQQRVEQHGVITVSMGNSSNISNHEITQEDVTWAKQIEKIVDIAFAAAQRNDHREAIRYYKKALELAPGCDLFLMSIGSSYAHLGQKKNALAYLERASTISPNNSRIRDNLNEVRKI
jgi:uncharacterized membrane protein YhaH (DUF805 family)/DNA-directed RNA polymerase subunit RPC12/RpoP